VDFVLVAGERRYRAAKQAKLKEAPAQVRNGTATRDARGGRERNPRRPERDRRGARVRAAGVRARGAAKVAKLVGRNVKLSGERLDLLRLPVEAQALLAARKLPLACAPALIRIAEREPLLADLTAVWLSERPKSATGFTVDPGEVVDDMLEAEWQDDDGQPLHPVAYSVGGWYGPLLPGGRNREEQLPHILRQDP